MFNRPFFPQPKRTSLPVVPTSGSPPALDSKGDSSILLWVYDHYHGNIAGHWKSLSDSEVLEDVRRSKREVEVLYSWILLQATHWLLFYKLASIPLNGELFTLVIRSIADRAQILGTLHGMVQRLPNGHGIA